MSAAETTRASFASSSRHAAQPLRDRIASRITHLRPVFTPIDPGSCVAYIQGYEAALRDARTIALTTRMEAE